MNLRELRYLVALAEHLHFGRAAEACNITQSTLSTQLRKLEGYLGQTLIDRQSTPMSLTPIGAQILEKARKVLQEADDILAITRKRASPLSGPLVLGIIPTLAPYYLPQLLNTVDKAFPDLRLVIQEGQTAELCARLENGLIDAAILALPTPLAGLTQPADASGCSPRHCDRCEAAVQGLPAPLDTRQYALSLLFDEPFRVALPGNHPLARGDQTPVTIADIDDLDLLLLSDGHCLRGQAMAICGQRAQQFADAALDCSATSLETLLQLIAAGRGWTLLPALAAPRADASRVKVLNLQGNHFRRLGLVWQRNSSRDTGLRLLAERLALSSRQSPELAPPSPYPHAQCRPLHTAAPPPQSPAIHKRIADKPAPQSVFLAPENDFR
ncbi:LysR substrate-binding domain-containing protein [Amphibiibacter pelophylacis]|uniref:LysR substrate-binding domain-containing protein n=1 Tax=Amphibiibacter pelophylacis TaxID=1799477 RepID=A0ACC6P4A7_9BURK